MVEKDINIALYNAYKHIGYVDKPHKYYDLNTRKELISVTTLIKKFQSPFDEDKWSKYKAKEYGITQEEVKKYWEKLRNLGTGKGSIVHDHLEQRWYGKVFEINYDKYIPPIPSLDLITFDKRQEKLVNMANSFVKENANLIPIRTELMVGNKKVAGQVDFFGYNLDTKKFIVLDYKGLDLNTPIPSPKGFIKMKDIKVGDVIFDSNGDLTKVKHVSKEHINPCYKITFNTNDTVIADKDHKWAIIKTERGKDCKYEMTTKELFLYNKINKRKNKLKIKVVKDIQLKEKSFIIDPYILGLWLGDGNSHCGSITCIYKEIWEEIKRRGYKISNNLEKNNQKAEYRTIYKLRTGLRKLNLLKNKHLPDIYLTGSFKQRLDLLRGFMDADGSYNKCRNRFDMTTTKEWQAKAIQSLVSSLGSTATIIKTKTSGFGKKDIPAFSITFKLDYFPFLIRNRLYKNKGKQTYQSKHKYIKKVEKTNTVKTKCLSVTSSTKCYLFGKNFTVTHNTDKVIKYGNDYQIFKAPLLHLDDCNYNKYSLQINMYLELLKIALKEDIENYIVWFNADNDTYKKIMLKDLKNEAKTLLSTV